MELGQFRIFAEVDLLKKGKPLPDFNYTQVAIPVLVKVVIHEFDPELLTDSLWALSYLSDGDENRIQINLDNNILVGLIKTLE